MSTVLCLFTRRHTDFKTIRFVSQCKYIVETRNPIIFVNGVLNHCRRLSDKKPKDALSKVKYKAEVQVGSKAVKEALKTSSYMGVMVIGLGITAVTFYAIFRELFSSKSANGVYSKALDRCCNDPRVQDALGTPIKGFGEETTRGRRRHVSYYAYEREGFQYMRMQFYLQGSRRRGTVHLEMKEDEKGKFYYRYMFVELDDYSRHSIVLEDNRVEKNASLLKEWELDLSQSQTLA